MSTNGSKSIDKILLIDDDRAFVEVLVRALARRNIESIPVTDIKNIRYASFKNVPYAIVDMLIGKESGLDLIAKLKSMNPQMRIVMMTGYASISTATEAIRRGAYDYLPKPASVDEILIKLGILEKIADKKMRHLENQPFEYQEWEYIQQALRECNGNIAATARFLNMHRRTLQRKLASPPGGLYS